MKKINYLLMGILALTFVLGSCTMEKRLYNKGYNVQRIQNYSTSKANSVKDEFKVKEEVNQTAETLAEEVPVKQTKKAVKNENKVNNVESVRNVQPTQKEVANNDVASATEEVPAVSSSFYKRNLTRSIQESNQGDNVNAPNDFQRAQSPAVVSGRGGGSSGAPLIILIILCFLSFLNLIAVYIHDGGITLNFWITLILDFTFIGGVIFSLLVVLDVVDLS